VDLLEWIKTKAGRRLHQCDGVHDGVQLSLEAIRQQLADINRKYVPQGDRTWKEGIVVADRIVVAG